MLGEQELDEFFAHIDEISQDSVSTDQFQHVQKLKNENSRLKVVLNSLRSSTREVLQIVKNERQQKLNALQELQLITTELETLRSSYNELDKSNVNNQFKYKESLDELEIQHKEEHENYIELAQDYFNVLSEATTFYNFEIKKDRNKVLCKTSKFLETSLGDKFQKPRLVVKRSSVSDTKSTGSKRTRSFKEKSPKVKKRKFDIWEMKSISEAASPMSFHDEELEETTEIESEYSFRTFSIGNETAFSALARKRFNTSLQCKCHIVTKDPDLVSIGINTDDLEPDLPRNMPSFNDDNIEFNQDDFISSTVNNCTSETKELPETPSCELSQSPEIAENIVYDPPEIESPKKPQTKSIGTLTENSEAVKETRDQETSMVIEKCSKSTSTVHSVTHRGTMTPGRVTRNIGIQFPDITFEKILEEMSFDLPCCISPIFDEIPEIEEIIVKSTKETQTELQGVNRELDYVVHKPENSDEKRTLSNEEQSFIVLGQTVFNLFMERLRETNKSLNDDAHTRQRLREQLLDRFDELTFDQYFSPSFVSVEAQENVLRKVFEDVRDTKIQKKSNFKEGYVNLDKNVHEAKNAQKCDIITQNIEQNEQICQIPEDNTQFSENLEDNTHVNNENESSPEQLQNSNIETSIAVKTTESSIENIELEVIGPVPQIEDICADLLVSSSEGSECSQEIETKLSGTSINSEVSENQDVDMQIIDSNDQEIANLEKSLMETDRIMESMQSLCSEPRKLISPIADLTDLIWSSVFPEEFKDTDAMEVDMSENCEIIEDSKVLDGYSIEHEPVEIPFYGENGTDCPYPPPELAIPQETPYDPIEIPIDSNLVINKNSAHAKALEFDTKMRLKLVTWQQNQQLKKNDDKRLCKIRKSINNYLNADWTAENLQACLKEISSKSQQLLLEGIFETVEDNQWEREINSEFTPPAPPLPRYQQKLIVLISKLSELHPSLPHKLVSDLEMRLFKCENSSADLDYLRNMAYYYTSLIDLFFNGDSTVVFYFIIKCLYFYGYKAIPMIFVLIKAFPLALPKKSTLMKKYSTNIDWEKMTGLEMSKVRLDLEWMDSLDLCVMYLMTNIQMYRRKGQEFKVIYEHELFNYLPKMYGFPLTFIAAPKLLDVLIKRLEDGELKNLSMSLILLGKRMNKDFTVRMLLKGKLVPLLKKYVDESLKSVDQKLIDKICLLIESISTILKPLTDEKDKTFNEIFPMIVNILGRSENQVVQEYCIKAILRLQRFIENHKEIYEIIKHHFEKQNSFSESLRHAIVTFIHRKKEAYFKE